MSTFSNPKIEHSSTMNAASRPSKPIEIDQEHEDLLTLSLSTRNSAPISPHCNHSPLMISTPSQPLSLFQQVPQPQPPPYDFHLPHLPHNSNNSPPAEAAGPARPTRTRRSPVQTLKQGKTETIPPPFPWATNKRATVLSLEHLLSAGIETVTGLVQCKKCDQSYAVEYDLRAKFMELAGFVTEHKCGMHDRAPAVWMNPTLPNCKFCDQSNCMKPVMSKKRSINWLFLLLGQMLGCCKLSELKYFCKHTKNHRTGAKDRVLYLTYLGLCKQLDPNGPFDV